MLSFIACQSWNAVHTKDGIGFLQIENQTAVLGDGGRSMQKMSHETYLTIMYALVGGSFAAVLVSALYFGFAAFG